MVLHRRHDLQEDDTAVNGNWRADLIVGRTPDLSLFRLLFHERAKCQSLTDDNYNRYLRSVGYKVAEELRLLRTIHICRHSTRCHCCSDDVIVGQKTRGARSERNICCHALSSGCPGCVNVKATVLHDLRGPQIAIGKASLVSSAERSYRLSGGVRCEHWSGGYRSGFSWRSDLTHATFRLFCTRFGSLDLN